MCEVFVSTLIAGWLYTGCLAQAQNPTCPTRPLGDKTNACASTAFVQNATEALFANPTAKVGLTAVNGTALTGIRSDGAPPLDQGISPTWIGTHIFTLETTMVSAATGKALITGAAANLASITGFYNETTYTRWALTEGTLTVPLDDSGPSVNMMRWVNPGGTSAGSGGSLVNYLFNTVWRPGARATNNPVGIYGLFAGISGQNLNVPTTGHHSVIALGGTANNAVGTTIDAYGVLTLTNAFSTLANALGYEVDIINQTGIDATAIQSGVTAPATFGLNIAGFGAKKNSVAVYIQSNTTGVFRTGIFFTANAVSEYAIDLLKVTSAVPIRLANNSALYARNQADSSDIGLLHLTTGNLVSLYGGQFTLSSAAAATIGVAGSTKGTLAIAGNTSGTATITPQAAAGTPTLTLPNASGTFGVSATTPITLNATTGDIGCSTCLTTASTLNLVVGTTTVSSGTTTRILYDNAGVLGEYTLTGTGTVVAMATSPTFVTQIIVPKHIGGSGTTGTQLTFQTTTGVGTTDSYSFTGGNNGGTTFATLNNQGLGLGVAPTSAANFGVLAINGSSGAIADWYLAGTGTFRLVVTAGGGQFQILSGSLPIFFYTNSSNQMFVGATGGVSIGTTDTSPGVGNLRVSGTTASTSKTTGSLVNSGGLGNAGAIFTDTLSVITMANAATTSAVCYNTGTGLTTYNSTVGTCTVSALAAKNLEDILSPARGLDIVMAMQPWRYNMRQGLPTYTPGSQYGMVAEFAARVDPALVAYNQDGSVGGFRYEQYTAVLTAAVQELKAANDNIRAELNELKQAVGGR